MRWKILSWQAVDRRLSFTYGCLSLFANAVGIAACFMYFIFFDDIILSSSSWLDNLWGLAVMSVFLMGFGTVLTRVWLKDIRRYVGYQILKRDISEKQAETAKRKIVNLPLISALISLLNWSMAAVIVPFFIAFGQGRRLIGFEIDSFMWVSTGIMISGGLTAIMVFFMTELMCRPIWEKFFPEGELIQTKGVFRVNLWPRILIIFLMVSLFPMIEMAVISYQKAHSMIDNDPAQVLKSFLFLILFLLTIEVSLVLVLSVFMSRSIVAPVLNLKSAMSKVAKGNFNTRAKVVDNNELGELSHHFNQMTKGLKERYELLETLAVAKEVQQNLLPDEIPDVTGLDIAGKSLYCDQTGGDYYDFIETTIKGKQQLIVAIGDVSGHGIPSALLMASARAFLRQRLALEGQLDQILNDVNVRFCEDVAGSGRFMTLFLTVINHHDQTFSWVRAGHDPALCYDPQLDTFSELIQKGGIPLGVDETFNYQGSVFDNQLFGKGQILFMGTDGIWESRNLSGKMFGKDRVKAIIRDHKSCTAGFILDALLEELKRFMGSVPYKDDVTLIIIKKD